MILENRILIILRSLNNINTKPSFLLPILATSGLYVLTLVIRLVVASEVVGLITKSLITPLSSGYGTTVGPQRAPPFKAGTPETAAYPRSFGSSPGLPGGVSSRTGGAWSDVLAQRHCQLRGHSVFASWR